MYPQLYPQGHNDFTLGGLPLLEATEIRVRKSLNNAKTLVFNIPYSSRNCKDIKTGAVVKADGQLYIINALGDGSQNGQPFKQAAAQHMFWYIAERKHIPGKFKVGAAADAVMQSAFQNISYGTNQLQMLSAAELSAMGLTPVTDYVDIYEETLNPLEVVESIQRHVNGELYVDNFNFALVRKLGRETNTLFTLDQNTQGVERTEDTTNIVTRLFPYGSGNLEITSIHGEAFIESPYINDYPIPYEGKIILSDYEDPAALLQRALMEFAPDNPFRIDRPRITYRISAVDLWKLTSAPQQKLHLGDYATIYDQELGYETKVRVVALETNPYDPTNSIITLGDPPRTIVDVLTEVDRGNSHFYRPFVPPFNMPPIPPIDTDEILDQIRNELETGLIKATIPIWRRIPTTEAIT